MRIISEGTEIRMYGTPFPVLGLSGYKVRILCTEI
jgi:hypothetical protein